MTKAKYPFSANVYCQQQISDIGNGRFGFDIPEYQRPYDWTSKNIERLFFDTLTSFSRLEDDSNNLNASDYTFLGGVILVSHNRGASNFEVEKYDVVDGQQRLTTLTLVACSLSSRLRSYRSTLTEEIVGSKPILKWLHQEISTIITGLDKCSLGTVEVGNGTSRFPKIIRSSSANRSDKWQSTYVTPIAKFLNKFSEYTEHENKHGDGKLFHPPKFSDRSTAAKKLHSNYKTIGKLIESINRSKWYSGRDFDQFQMQSIHHKKYQDLFRCIKCHFNDRAKINATLSELENNTDLEHIIRILLFSSHIYTRVLLTLIITSDELAAFDIFDSLNTTGQPITALETLKPRVVSYENKCDGFKKSESESAYEKINDNIDETTEATSTKQSISRELVILFSVYLDGSKLGNSLSLQRTFLITAYQVATNEGRETARRFMTEIANLCEFKHYYFDCPNFAPHRAKFASAKHIERAKLLSSFITSMNTSMAIPLLYRYWRNDHGKIQDETKFMDVLKAVTAFIVLRRAATGGTDGIDGDFRLLMSDKSVPDLNLPTGNGVGPILDHKEVSVGKLKSALVKLLEKKFAGFDKESWIERVIQIPLYKKSQPLVRFMILATADNALPSESVPGTWYKLDLRDNKTSARYFRQSIWTGEEYSTVEHIAPDKPEPEGWDKSLYVNDDIRHRLGNLILLPARENSAIGNQGWQEKRVFYRAATSMTKPEVNQYLDDAANNGITLPSKTQNILRKGNKLEILVPLNDLEKFNEKVVEARAKNIANLCWDFFWPWLTK